MVEQLLWEGQVMKHRQVQKYKEIAMNYYNRQCRRNRKQATQFRNLHNMQPSKKLRALAQNLISSTVLQGVSGI